jgi:hypothetical protein
MIILFFLIYLIVGIIFDICVLYFDKSKNDRVFIGVCVIAWPILVALLVTLKGVDLLSRIPYWLTKRSFKDDEDEDD